MASRAHTPLSWAALATASVLILASAPPVEAQEYGFDIRLDRERITPRHDRSDIEVWAWFTPTPTWSVFAVASFDLVAQEPVFSVWNCSPPPCMACPFHPEPIYSAGRISGIGAIQSIIDPCSDNPIWTGTSSWGPLAGDFKPRAVEIWIECETFAVRDPAYEIFDLRDTHPHGFRDGRTTVYITDCEADMDWDGQLTFFDFLEFLSLYAAGAMDADCNGDETLNFEDFLCFQNDFARGCP